MSYLTQVGWIAWLSAGIQLLLLVLGVFATLGEVPSKWRVRWLVPAFVILAFSGSAISIIQSTKSQSDAAYDKAALSSALSKLERSESEGNRMASLNTQLQERLLKLADTNLRLSRESLHQITGAGQFCYLTVYAEPLPNRLFQLAVQNSGRYPLQKCLVTIFNNSPGLPAEEWLRPIRIEDLAELVPLGKDRSAITDIALSPGRYVARINTRNESFIEQIEIRPDGKASLLVQGGPKGDVLYSNGPSKGQH